MVAAVISDELGYEVEMIALDGGPMFHALSIGELDAIVAAWLPFDHAAYWDAYGADLVDYGPNLEGAGLGFVVPSYVEAESIADLNDYYEEFNGQIIGIDPGAGLTLAAEGAIEAYGVELTLIDGSGFAMTAALESAISQGEWIAVSGWKPHWKWLVHDLKFLDDPKEAFGGIESIHTVLSIPFSENGPADVLHFLEQFYWSHDAMNTVMLDINHHQLEPWDAARKWISENQETVQAWLP